MGILDCVGTVVITKARKGRKKRAIWASEILILDGLVGRVSIRL